ncbi:beta-N-acetylglucosaminidase domain-containing protein [Flavobacterium granuli]|uniref:Hyaluronoglucosaminidase n=1 Tax=Flavobacterium granuli TaxID=280093 RepID=A0A1M5IE57_9FLAO|nr:beta-N-acetylglucosaminidase domain-containing protein [Flavobacterium granuli]PRZ27926.1 hyaluronoglucosaminidase [Flavobacterium granuli]SHG26535.1 hyaluronoglucosaminidase [Flavobacterium granuli]
MKLKHLLLTALFLSFVTTAWTQTDSYTIFPNPQIINLSGQKISADVSYKLEGNFKLKPNSLALLNEIFNVQNKSKPLTVIINPITKTDKNLQISGAYTLKITAKAIEIAVYDNRSVFYALQTLKQLKKDNSLPTVDITDFPDVLSRGSVEGFYGTPWSHEDRISQFKFYGKLKLNTYIYGPKDDPYHSSPNWRKPYPAENAKQIKELVQEANNNEVDFTWAIHPGLDIQWNNADRLAILNKLEWMYDLGIRSFAVFFDDISGEGTKAEKQAELLNYIQKQFIEKKKDVLPLIMCPTEYNKAWSDPKPNTYLDILGDQLHPSIQIMWTGDRVIDDVSKADLDWINKRIKRKAYIWWNFPVSDYVRDHLLMGAAYGLDTTIKNDLSGFVSNPMERAEASKLALFSVALYSWNLKSYEPMAAWHAAAKYIMPEAATAFQLFNEHNSDLGPNGHRYRREESVIIKPVIDSFLTEYKNNTYSTELATKIKTEFERIIPVTQELRDKCLNKNLIREIDPWLTQFNLLGKAGLQTMLFLEAKESGNKAMAWDNYLKTKMLLDSIQIVDKTFNQNPYQPGVKTGSLVLMPFVKTVFDEAQNYFIPTIANSENHSTTALISNTEKLKNQPLQLSNTSIAISPVLEVLNLNPQEYLGIRLDKSLKAKEFHFNLESNNLMEGGAFETSVDGLNWQTLNLEQKRGKGSLKVLTDGVKYIRYKNDSANSKSLFLKEFKVIVEAENKNTDQTIYVQDYSIATYLELNAKNELNLPLSLNKQTKTISLLVQNSNKPFEVNQISKRGKKTPIYKGAGNYIVIPSKQLKKATAIEINSNGNKDFRIYEILEN